MKKESHLVLPSHTLNRALLICLSKRKEKRGLLDRWNPLFSIRPVFVRQKLVSSGPVWGPLEGARCSARARPPSPHVCLVPSFFKRKHVARVSRSPPFIHHGLLPVPHGRSSGGRSFIEKFLPTLRTVQRGDASNVLVASPPRRNWRGGQRSYQAGS